MKGSTDVAVTQPKPIENIRTLGSYNPLFPPIVHGCVKALGFVRQAHRRLELPCIGEVGDGRIF
jgi:hypothetical protein